MWVVLAGLRYGVCYLFIPVKVVKHVFFRISRTVVDCAPSVVPIGITSVLKVMEIGHITSWS